MNLTDKIIITNEDNMSMMDRYPDKYFDLAIVDPPYGIRVTKMNMGGRNTIKPDNDKNWDSNIPSSKYFDELFRVSKNQIIWGFNNLCDLLPPTKEFIFWYKHQPVISYYQADGELAWTSFNKTAKCFDYPYFGSHNSDTIRIHPTQKPVALYKWLLKKYAKEGDKILDTHLGSGSIAIACHDYGIELTACELDKDYYDAATKRINNHIKQLTLF